MWHLDCFLRSNQRANHFGSVCVSLPPIQKITSTKNDAYQNCLRQNDQGNPPHCLSQQSFWVPVSSHLQHYVTHHPSWLTVGTVLLLEIPSQCLLSGALSTDSGAFTTATSACSPALQVHGKPACPCFAQPSAPMCLLISSLLRETPFMLQTWTSMLLSQSLWESLFPFSKFSPLLDSNLHAVAVVKRVMRTIIRGMGAVTRVIKGRERGQIYWMFTITRQCDNSFIVFILLIPFKGSYYHHL